MVSKSFTASRNAPVGRGGGLVEDVNHPAFSKAFMAKNAIENFLAGHGPGAGGPMNYFTC